MKILWLCNIVLPELLGELRFRGSNYGGWLTGLWDELKKNKTLYQLGICVPIRNPERAKDGEYEGYKYYSFLTISKESDTTTQDQVSRFCTILDDFNPDIVHVWGTEYEHSASMVKACEKKGIVNRVLINIQGLITFCERLYEYGLPKDIVIREIQGNSIRNERSVFGQRSISEKYVLERVKHVIGRTDWDKGCVEEINPSICYHRCGEVLRKSFYNNLKWNPEKCNKNSVFISQASYPIKGLHLILDEFVKLKERYPDFSVRIAGLDLTKMQSSYALYICERLVELNLFGNIRFLGSISETEMVDEYLRANVFLSASVIENSSNSICEAMMLGTPVVTSFVGGTGSVVEHGKSGLLFPLNEPYIMTHYIREVFENEKLAIDLSQGGIARATLFNNRIDIVNRIETIYAYIFCA